MRRIAYCIPNFQLDVHSEEGSGRPADFSEDKTEGPNFWTNTLEEMNGRAAKRQWKWIWILGVSSCAGVIVCYQNYLAMETTTVLITVTLHSEGRISILLDFISETEKQVSVFCWQSLYLTIFFTELQGMTIFLHYLLLVC